MTTNGIALKRKLSALKTHGLDHLNISLDTLDPLQFQLMTRRNGLDKVLGSIQQALELGYTRIKLNVVVIKGVNEAQLTKFVELTRRLPVYVRFIEYMPFGGIITFRISYCYRKCMEWVEIFGLQGYAGAYSIRLPTSSKGL